MRGEANMALLREPKFFQTIELKSGDRVVLVDYDRATTKNNLFRIDSSNNVVWEAETVERSCYFSVQLDQDKLTAMSAEGWLVELDIETGKIVSATYAK